MRIFSIQGFRLSNSSIDMVSTLGSVHDITTLKMAIIDKVDYIDNWNNYRRELQLAHVHLFRANTPRKILCNKRQHKCKRNSAFTYMMLVCDSFQALFGIFSISQLMSENIFVALVIFQDFGPQLLAYFWYSIG